MTDDVVNVLLVVTAWMLVLGLLGLLEQKFAKWKRDIESWKRR